MSGSSGAADGRRLPTIVSSFPSSVTSTPALFTPGISASRMKPSAVSNMFTSGSTYLPVSHAAPSLQAQALASGIVVVGLSCSNVVDIILRFRWLNYLRQRFGHWRDFGPFALVHVDADLLRLGFLGFRQCDDQNSVFIRRLDLIRRDWHRQRQ